MQWDLKEHNMLHLLHHSEELRMVWYGVVQENQDFHE